LLRGVNEKYMIIALNDNYTCFILWKADTLEELIDIDIDTVSTNIQKVENSNRLLCSIYQLVHDLTSNPLFVHKIHEVFKK